MTNDSWLLIESDIREESINGDKQDDSRIMNQYQRWYDSGVTTINEDIQDDSGIMNKYQRWEDL